MGASRQIQTSITHARTSVLDTLQCGRGLAALGVMITHYSTNTRTFVDPLLPDCPARVFQSFAFGVDFFFVLSGFIILNAHFHENGRSLRIKNYVIKRLSRIYVPYLPITLALIAAYLIFPHFSSTNREWGWVSSLFLFPTSYAPALGVAWTLECEMMFYTIFLSYFINVWIFVSIVGLWMVAMAVAAVTGLHPDAPFFALLLDPINFDFILGLLCAYLYRRGSIDAGRGKYLVIAGITGFAFVSLSPCFEMPSLMRFWTNIVNVNILVGTSFAAIVLGCALGEEQLRSWIPASMVKIGDASYAIYLIHVPIGSLLVRVPMKVLPALWSWPACLSFLLLGGFAAGLAYHHFVERPGLAAVRRFVSGRMPAGVKTPRTIFP